MSRGTGLRLVPLLAAAALGLAACGGGSESPGRAAGTVATTAAPAPPTDPAQFSGAGSERFCEDDRAFRQRLEQTGRSAQAGDSVRERYVATAESLRSLSAVAPDEIAPTVRVLTQAYDAVVDGMQRTGWDPAQLLRVVSERLGTTEVKEASERLQSYERTVCGIS